MGFHYLGLATDQQRHAYVLRRGESDAPAGLRAALADGNRLQDIHLAEMQVGRRGNEVLRDCATDSEGGGDYVHRFIRTRSAITGMRLDPLSDCGIGKMASLAPESMPYLMIRFIRSN